MIISIKRRRRLQERAQDGLRSSLAPCTVHCTLNAASIVEPCTFSLLKRPSSSNLTRGLHTRSNRIVSSHSLSHCCVRVCVYAMRSPARLTLFSLSLLFYSLFTHTHTHTGKSRLNSSPAVLVEFHFPRPLFSFFVLPLSLSVFSFCRRANRNHLKLKISAK